MFYIGTEMVGRRLNLCCKRNSFQGEVLICDKYCQPRMADVPTSDKNGMLDVKVQVRSVTLSNLISCGGRLDSYQERNAFKPHFMNSITYLNAWQLSSSACGNGMT